MVFSELYSAYYTAVAAILSEAVKHPLSDAEIRSIAERKAFGESSIAITKALKDGQWQLLDQDGAATVRNIPSMPFTNLQKQWLKAIELDPRIRLFGDVHFDFPDVDPLFTPDDVCVFDQYSDGDDYEDPAYIENFRLILEAIKEGYALYVETLNRKGNLMKRIVYPQYLEYSERDDKFRVIGAGDRFGNTINLGRIVKCCKADKNAAPKRLNHVEAKPCKIEFELIDKRNALERVLLHFAHFEKEVEKVADNKYHVTITCDMEDQTEMVIRVLSFGPMIKVTAPDFFIDLIKDRLRNQMNCMNR